MKSIAERIEFLKECARLYETGGNSPLTDVEYDKEYYALKKTVPDDPFFNMVGGIDPDHAYGSKYTHKYVMGSLNKDPNPQDFGVWYGKTYQSGVKAVLDLKVDGCSICCHYEDGKLVRVVTRGDGKIGVDVTPNALYVAGVLPTISEKGQVEVKGECYKNRQDFYRDWAGKVSRSGKTYANPRNFAAGSLNQKDPLVTKERGLSFVAYEVRGMDFPTELDKIKFLKDNRFENLSGFMAKINCHGRSAKEVAGAVQKFMDRVDRDKLHFDIDGVVFKLNDIEKAEEMGYTNDGKNPKANRAIKFPTDQQVTVLEGIEWSIGRTGALTPVGLLKAVQLAGTTVQRVSLHNLAELKRLGIERFGCLVVVEKAGDIIPKVVRKDKDGNGQPIQHPNICPVCESSLEWDDNRVTKWCKNETCPSQVNRAIEHWFKKLGVKGIGSGIIESLTGDTITSQDSRWRPVASISDMYNIHKAGGILARHFGKRASEKIIQAIDSVKEVPLNKFIESLGIGQIGRMAKDITAVAPVVEDIDKLTVQNVASLDGFAETKAKAFVYGWKSMRPEIGKLLRHIEIKDVKPASDKLSGKKFCFTGSFSSPSRKEMEKMVEDNGGKKSSVSKTLTALVWDGAMTGSKYDKAKSLGVDIISQADFLTLLK